MRLSPRRHGHQLRATLAWGIIGAAVWSVIHFSLMKGDLLVQTNYALIERFLPVLAPLYRLEQQYQFQAFDGRVETSLINTALIESLAQDMENWIHIILFALLILVCLFALKKIGLRHFLNIPLSLTACALYAYYSEVYQMNIYARGYEERDVINNLIGIAIGLLFFLLSLLLHTLRQKAQQNAYRGPVAFAFMDKQNGHGHR